MKRPTDEETEEKYWYKPIGDVFHIMGENNKSLCSENIRGEYNEKGDRSQPLIPEDDPNGKVDCIECCNKAGFEGFKNE